MEDLLQHSPTTETVSMGRPGPTHPSKTNASKPETDHKTSIGGNDDDYDSDPAHPQQQNRTRQKKFIKNFKHLPSEEIVLQREFKLNRMHHCIILAFLPNLSL